MVWGWLSWPFFRLEEAVAEATEAPLIIPNLGPGSIRYGIELEFVLAFNEQEIDLEDPNHGPRHGIAKDLPLSVRRRREWSAAHLDRLPNHFYNSWGIVEKNDRTHNEHGELVNARRYKLEPHIIVAAKMREKAPSIDFYVRGPQKPADKVEGAYDRWIISNDWTVCGQGSANLPKWLPHLSRSVANRWDSFGMEVISPVFLSDSLEDKQEIEQVAEAIKGTEEELSNAFITNQCALHVHVEAPNIDVLRELAAILLIYEDELSRLHPPCRHPSHRAAKGNLESNRLRIFLGSNFRIRDSNDTENISRKKNISTTTYTLKQQATVQEIRQELEQLNTEEEIAAFLNFPSLSRLRPVNMRSLAVKERDEYQRPRTIEFRQARGSLNIDEISHWIDFCVNLVKLAEYYVRTPDARIMEWEPQLDDFERYGTHLKPASIHFLLHAMQLDEETVMYWERKIARYMGSVRGDVDERSDTEVVLPRQVPGMEPPRRRGGYRYPSPSTESSSGDDSTGEESPGNGSQNDDDSHSDESHPDDSSEHSSSGHSSSGAPLSAQATVSTQPIAPGPVISSASQTGRITRSKSKQMPFKATTQQSLISQDPLTEELASESEEPSALRSASDVVPRTRQWDRIFRALDHANVPNPLKERDTGSASRSLGVTDTGIGRTGQPSSRYGSRSSLPPPSTYRSTKYRYNSRLDTILEQIAGSSSGGNNGSRGDSGGRRSSGEKRPSTEPLPDEPTPKKIRPEVPPPENESKSAKQKRQSQERAEELDRADMTMKLKQVAKLGAELESLLTSDTSDGAEAPTDPDDMDTPEKLKKAIALSLQERSPEAINDRSDGTARQLHGQGGRQAQTDEEVARGWGLYESGLADNPPNMTRRDLERAAHHAAERVATLQYRIPNLPPPSLLSTEPLVRDAYNHYILPNYNPNDWHRLHTSMSAGDRNYVCAANAVVLSLRAQYPNEDFTDGLTPSDFLTQYLDCVPPPTINALHPSYENHDQDEVNYAIQSLTGGELSLVWVPAGAAAHGYPTGRARMTLLGRPGMYLYLHLVSKINGVQHWEGMQRKRGVRVPDVVRNPAAPSGVVGGAMGRGSELASDVAARTGRSELARMARDSLLAAREMATTMSSSRRHLRDTSFPQQPAPRISPREMQPPANPALTQPSLIEPRTTIPVSKIPLQGPPASKKTPPKQPAFKPPTRSPKTQPPNMRATNLPTTDTAFPTSSRSSSYNSLFDEPRPKSAAPTRPAPTQPTANPPTRSSNNPPPNMRAPRLPITGTAFPADSSSSYASDDEPRPKSATPIRPPPKKPSLNNPPPKEPVPKPSKPVPKPSKRTTNPQNRQNLVSPYSSDSASHRLPAPLTAGQKAVIEWRRGQKSRLLAKMVAKNRMVVWGGVGKGFGGYGYLGRGGMGRGGGVMREGRGGKRKRPVVEALEKVWGVEGWKKRRRG
ncbi:amidoligase enzyme protein [Rutstroemia sp. NJR-2017a BVV2]|nr:amidoligase enzyme protein [Rutstroemia sp. NJR-2017a BVV2]PQE18508.1 amidoligase enzyme protein [Rutstroemia sp. NJR-2017a BVV2]